MTDYIDKLTHSEPEMVRESAGRNSMGIVQVNCMAVPARCPSSEEMDKWEAGYEATCMQQLPIPFWSDDDTLEPFNSMDLEMLKAAGVTPDEMEMLLLEEKLERKTP